jgi:ATP synthase protein I
MKNRNEIVRALAMVTQLGINMLAPVVLCAFIGVWLDEKYGWSVTAVLLILGIMAGARNSWILLKQMQPPVSKRRQKDETENQ